VSFLANPKYFDRVASTNASAVIVAPGVEAPGKTLLIAKDPYFAFRNAVVELHGFRKHPQPADGPISRLAVIHPTAKIGEGTVVHPFCVVEANATIGKGCILYPHVFVGPSAKVGDDCQLYPNVVIYDQCVLGNRVTLHAGCVIGQDGFGYATHKGAHHKIPQVGNAVIEDDVEMGANCAIDRATIGSTVIGHGTKFSDAVTIGHGTKVGRHNLYVAMVGLAGSVETGDYVVIGGQSGVAGHLKIGHQSQIAASSGVMTDIPDKTQFGGTPAMPLTEAKRIHLMSLRLPDLLDRVKKLERQLKKLGGEPGV
jgi:UDP-3-O-[3-hydroxymyristoyl] glucosamine N-acyltransferase